ncbi:hypothetical protein BDN72DRAFT_846169 [Pluteus cervinus]|uniref:Uncharacterized protein n=1 Tax=Pluteus cervinus TaxID=181527 RepID=A0ACD3AH06_9AGAR|nr:hypothetical protein BDN72DRAFT_846169 [Pluteus cervinus]
MSSSRLTINDLPNEMLVLIFSACHCSQRSPYITIPPNLNSSPWNITLVSSRWRAIALKMPSLWEHIFFDFNERQLPHPRPLFQFAQFSTRTMTLARSVLERTWKNRPLYISNDEELTDNQGALTNLDSFIPAFVHFIGPISSRIRRLDFQCNSPGFVSLLSLKRGSFSNLEEVTFFIRAKGAIPLTHRSWVSAFENARQLSKVTFKSQGVLLNPAQLNIPWTRLTFLHFVYTDVQHTSLPNILRTCQNLTNLRLDLCNPLPAHYNPPMITLPSLISFDYRVTQTSNQLFVSFDLPSIQYLTLRLMSFWSFTGFTVFASRSCCRLKGIHLVFTTPGTSSFYVGKVLPLLLNTLGAVKAPVVDCRILSSHIPKEVFAKLVNALFPSLKLLTAGTGAPTTVAEFLDAVEAIHNRENSNGERKFRTATMIVREEMEETNRRKVEELLAKGIDLRVVPFRENWNDPPQWDEPL